VTKKEQAPFPWASVIRFGLGRLRLAPETFWALSLPELAALIGAETHPGHATRNDLEDLMARFPDRFGTDPQESASRQAARNHGGPNATLPSARTRRASDD
jgi:uncharacterized phage protein (TIGR02216 family)